MRLMKTTIEVPDALLQRARASAAQRGQTLNEFVTEAMAEKLAARHDGPPAEQGAWMAGFGKLRQLRKETARVQRRIDQEFGGVDRRLPPYKGEESR